MSLVEFVTETQTNPFEIKPTTTIPTSEIEDQSFHNEFYNNYRQQQQTFPPQQSSMYDRYSLNQQQPPNQFYLMDPYQRKIIVDRFIQRILSKFFNWFENTNLFKTSLQYSQEWRNKMMKNPNYLINERIETDPYASSYYNINQRNAIYSRHEAFIRSLVDYYISFKRMLSPTNLYNKNNNVTTEQEEIQQEKQLASQIANRIDRYTFHESTNYRRN
ncbi:hypothetical protein ABK040_015321 [Willaertia magna]